jgi:hypothetical protein
VTTKKTNGNGNDDEAAALAAATGHAIEGHLIPKSIDSDARMADTKRRYSTASVKGCRQEMSRIYRLTRDGFIEPDVGSKLTYMLGQISKLIIEAEIEARVRRLEEAANNG